MLVHRLDLYISLVLFVAAGSEAIPTGREHGTLQRHDPSISTPSSALLNSPANHDSILVGHPLKIDHRLQTSSFATSRTVTYTTDAAQQASLANLRARNAIQVERALRRHQSVAVAHQGKSFHDLQDHDKAEIKKTRQYFHDKASKAKKQGDFAQMNEWKSWIGKLPTPYIERHPPSGPLSPTMESKLKRARNDREYRERKATEAFMAREFGVTPPTRKRGPKPRDLSAFDPQKAKAIVDRRNRVAQWRQKVKQSAKMHDPLGAGSSKSASHGTSA